MFQEYNWVLIVPMANEEQDFFSFIDEVKKTLDQLCSGTVYLVIDTASKDKTLALCEALSKKDIRFRTVWAPENKNVVDAYIRGYNEALKSDADYFIEMDAGLSHDPVTVVQFLQYLNQEYECVFGSRFIEGGDMGNSPMRRKILSKLGTVLSTILLGTKLHDMTSGYQGFTREVVEKFTQYHLRSNAHFYQTEIRYLLRKRKLIEIPISYRTPSPRVSKGAIKNSLQTLNYYFWSRITFRAISL